MCILKALILTLLTFSTGSVLFAKFATHAGDEVPSGEYLPEPLSEQNTHTIPTTRSTEPQPQNSYFAPKISPSAPVIGFEEDDHNPSFNPPPSYATEPSQNNHANYLARIPVENPNNRQPEQLRSLSAKLQGLSILEKHLIEYPQCTEEIERYCPKSSHKTDINIIICLEEDRKDSDMLSGDCQHILWQAKLKLSEDDRFSLAAREFCSAELKKYTDCVPRQKNSEQDLGQLASCLIDHKEEMTQSSKCQQFLTRMESIMFADWRLIGRFVKGCEGDIVRLGCGRIDYQADSLHTQSEVIECMLRTLVEEQQEGDDEDSAKHVTEQCKEELMRIAVLQSDDFHLDRPLYFACREDRESFCSEVQAGEGRVLACLMHHIHDRRMSAECGQKLVLREQIIAQDYRVSHPLVRSCGADINKYQCAPQQPPAQRGPDHYFLSYILLCLENAMHTGQPIAGQCQAQLDEHRRLLMSDFNMSPEIVLSCAREIADFCGNGLDTGGKTIHCLMSALQTNYASSQKDKNTPPFSPQCARAVKHLVKVADVASNYQVDPIFQESCGSAIDTLCKDAKANEIDVISCLMDNIDSKAVSDSCERHLLEIQYFMARDFSLDARLFRACHEEAVQKCNANEKWWGGKPGPGEDTKPDPSGIVLPCLYRHAYSDDANMQLSAACASEVKRVLRQRTTSVRLLPQIEDVCLHDLAAFCSQKTGPGEELMCLQENYDQIQAGCKDAVLKFTEMQSKDVRLNRVLERACKPVVEKYCADKLTEDIDSMDVMRCLIEHRPAPEMRPKCEAYIRHYELVSMKDYRFSHKFKSACEDDVKQLCKDTDPLKRADNIHSKAEIIRCLSQNLFEHKLLGENDGLSEACRRQLRVEYLMVEQDTGEMDQELIQKCGKDLKALKCKKDKNPLECLRRQKSELSKDCHQYVFRHEELEMVDQRYDYVLMKSCRGAIELYCSTESSDEILACLKKHRKQPTVSGVCRKVVEARMREQASDIRLQPALRKSCKHDIEKHCMQQYQSVVKAGLAEEDTNNVVVQCLRKVFVSSSVILTLECREEVKTIIADSELDPRLDPQFYAACKASIKRYCEESLIQGDRHAGIMECLKSRLYENIITDERCVNEMKRRTDEELTDIHVDPALHEVCSLDIQRYCKDVVAGGGRVINCLLDATKSTNIQLNPKCRGKLEDRKRFWKVIYKEKLPATFTHFAQVLNASPVRGTVMTMVAVEVVVLFILGLIRMKHS